MAEKNRTILDWIETIGGGYVWEAEVFAVTLLPVPITDDDARRIGRLQGVQQLAVDASQLSEGGLKELAAIRGLQSLVVAGRTVSPQLRAAMKETIPGLEISEAAGED